MDNAAVLTASVTIVLFIILRLWEMWTGWREEASARRRLVVGIYTEIKANLDLINNFTRSPGLVSAIQAKILANPNYRPSVVVEESTKLVDAAGPSLFQIRSDVLIHVLEFYRLIEQTKALKEVFESAAFLTIEPASRSEYMQDLWDAALAAGQSGAAALRELLKTYPRAGFP